MSNNIRLIKNPEHRYRCNKCKWDGLATHIIAFKKMSGGKKFPICPKCFEHKIEVVDGTLKYNKSVLVGYAVEKKEA
jgi:hypothetical protein